MGCFVFFFAMVKKIKEIKQMKEIMLTYSRMEDIDRIHCRFSLLFVTKDEVDPGCEVSGHVVWLEGLSVYEGKETGVVTAPGRESHMIHCLPVLSDTQSITWQSK